MNYLLAHDLGTSGNKASLFTTDGRLIKSTVRQYPCRYFNDTWAEQNPADWFHAVCESTKELIEAVHPEDILGISFSGQMSGAVLLDEQGTLLRPAIIWADQRSDAERRFISEAVSDDMYYKITGNRNASTYSLQKLLWVKNNENVFHHMKYILNCKDYIAYRLTGMIGTDYSDAAGTGAFDINTFSWSEEILDSVKIPKELFPSVYPSSHKIGEITSEAASLTGLLAGTPVFCGCADGVAATVGSGISKPGEAYCCLGSSAWICYMDENPYLDPSQRTFNLAGIEKGVVYPCGTMQAACLSYEWMKDELCGYETFMANEQKISPYSLINEQISHSPAGANGLIYLPYLLGERAPWWDEKARGAFIGLKKEHSHADMLRSVVEGVTMNLALILNIFRNNYPLSSLRVIGGGARNPLWLQIMSDIWNADIKQLNHVEEACSIGAAVTAGIGAGVFKDSSEVKRFLDVENSCTPDQEAFNLYQKSLALFTEYYLALRPIFNK